MIVVFENEWRKIFAAAKHFAGRNDDADTGFSKTGNVRNDSSVVLFAELPILPNYDKKTHHVENTTQHSSLDVGNHRSTSR